MHMLFSMEEEKLVPLRGAKSKLWDYFGFRVDSSGKIIDNTKILCKVCRKEISYSRNTSNLDYHLTKEHVELKSQMVGKNAAIQPLSKTQPTLDMTLNRTIPYPKTHARYRELVSATADFICQDLQPISVVEAPSFRYLLEKADPRFQLPHRTFFTTKVIPEQYHLLRATIENELAAVQYCGFTTDLWTSSNQNRSYISLTLHYVSSNFEMRSRCLHTKEVPQEHTAEVLASVLEEMLKEWQVRPKIYAATTDNGRNIVNACVQHMEIFHLPCFGHTMQLAVKKALDLHKVSRVIARCSKLVGFFHHSTKAMYKFREKQA